MRRPTSLSDAFRRVVADRRRGSGLSQEALALRAGLHRTYIGMIERGQRNPTLDAAKAIADALDVQLATLIREAERRLDR
jgi:transcriptional regulator with XRE-family HTH domain